MGNYASNIELEILIRESQQNNKPIDKGKLTKILHNNKDNFVGAAMGLKKIKFIGANNKITPEIKELMQDVLKDEISNKKDEISKNIKGTIENYFKNNQDHKLSIKRLK